MNMQIKIIVKKSLILVGLIWCSNFLNAQVVVIDPGHGYCTHTIHNFNHDGRLAIEMETALDVGVKLKNQLERDCAGWQVHLTRTSNNNGSWIALSTRRTMSNSWGADRFLSIHTNAGGGTGTETFWCTLSNQSDGNLVAFADEIQRQMVSFGEWRNRRVTEDDSFIGIHLGVLNGNNAIGCLNEIGFGDSSDNVKLGSNSWRDRFAEGYKVALSNSLARSCNGGCGADLNFISTIDSGIYTASNTISANTSIANGANVSFDAKNTIFLNTGFNVNSASSSSFTAIIGAGCDARKDLSSEDGFDTFSENIANIGPALDIYPNPSSGIMNISFTSLTNTNIVNVKMYDNIGKLVNEPIKNEHYVAGEHTITIDANKYAAGIYFCAFTNNNGVTLTKKVLIER